MDTYSDGADEFLYCYKGACSEVNADPMNQDAFVEAAEPYVRNQLAKALVNKALVAECCDVFYEDMTFDMFFRGE